MILVQTDQDGLVTFQDMARQSRINYAVVEKLDQPPYEDIKEEPVNTNNSDEEEPQLMTTQDEEFINAQPPQQTFYRDDNDDTD